MDDWLPDGWNAEIKTAKDGSKIERYFNSTTGQQFNTKEDMLRYSNYLKNVAPHLEAFNNCYLDPKTSQYVDRPWETDPEHNMHDYIQGRVGKLAENKKQEEGRTSAANVDEMPEEKTQQTSKGKKKKSKKRKRN